VAQVKANQLQPGFRSSRALVIGISEYQNLRKLENAAKDAKAVVVELERLGWDVKPLYDKQATEEGISRAIDALIRDVDPEDRLLFYYAGHGAKTGLRDDVGHLQPVDADPDNQRTWISFERLKELRSYNGAKHSLALLDCCYGGTATTDYGGSKRSSSISAEEAWTRDRAWEVITSGLSTETVEDQWFPGGDSLGHSPCLLYTSPSPRDRTRSRMPSSA